MNPTIDPDQVMQVWCGVRTQRAADLNPQLDVLLVDGSRHIAILEDPRNVVDAVGFIARRMDLPVWSIAYMADAFVRDIPLRDAHLHQRGDSERAVRRGDSNATEALVVVVIDSDRVLHVRQVPYVQAGGVPLFGEPTYTDEPTFAGAVAALLREAMEVWG